MSEFVMAGGGKIGFRKNQYRFHTCGDHGFMEVSYHITLFTDTKPGGWIIHFPSRAERDAAALEIAAQLASSEQSQTVIPPPSEADAEKNRAEEPTGGK